MSLSDNLPKQMSKQLVKDSLGDLVTFKQHPRPWHMPLMVAIAVSFPVFLGAWLDQLAIGLLASLGSMVVLNLPYEGSFFFRMAQVLACSFGFVASFAMGLIAHLVPVLVLPLVFVVTFWVTLFSRYFRLGPPGGLFILMATSIAVFMPIQPNELPYYTGLVALGCLFSGVIACVYTIFIFLNKPSVAPLEFHYQPAQFADSVVIAATSTVSLAVALEINMPRPYWVLVGCYVVISGMSFLSMWHKQVQRIVGTTTGMGVAWLIFMLQPDPWGVAALLLVLIFLIETVIVRNYVLAATFITPLTILIAEYSHPDVDAVAILSQDVMGIISARFWDTVLGCVIGIIGGFIMHTEAYRAKLHIFERWVLGLFK